MSFLVGKLRQVPKLVVPLQQGCIPSSTMYFTEQAELQGQADEAVGAAEPHTGLTTCFGGSKSDGKQQQNLLGKLRERWKGPERSYIGSCAACSHLEGNTSTWKGGDNKQGLGEIDSFALFHRINFF